MGPHGSASAKPPINESKRIFGSKTDIFGCIGVSNITYF
jgi:hypothetical protein